MQIQNRVGTDRAVRVSGFGVACAFVIATAMLPQVRAQAGELARQAQWSVDAPAGGCSSLPVLQVKGPGTLFDAGNAAQLASLQGAVVNALGRVCPGVTEVILANGRTRKLVRLTPLAKDASAANAAVSGASPGTPVETTDRVPLLSGATNRGSRASTRVPNEAERQPGADDREAPPHFPRQSSLPSLSSAHGAQAKCDVLFRWLETGKASTPGRRVGAAQPTQMLEIFQDRAMTAVFGRTYDGMENSARIELYEKTFGTCTGTARRTPPQRSPIGNKPIVIGGVRIGAINVGQQPEAPLPPEYRQEFAQYNELLHEAFGGSPGRYEPSAVTAYVQQVRDGMKWANEEVTTAAEASATLEAFRRMQSAEGEAGQKAPQLTAAEREELRAYLRRREVAIAPTIAKKWLAGRTDGTSDLPSAKALAASHAEVGGVLAALEPEERKRIESEYSERLERQLTPLMQAATAPLATLPADWQGARAFGVKESAFLAEFGEFQSTSSYATAASRFDATRERIFPAVLPEWRRKVAASKPQSGELLALRDDLRTLFVAPADRALPLFQQFEEPVRQRQAQFDAAMAADEQRRLAQAERAAAEEAARTSGEALAPAPADQVTVRGTSTSHSGVRTGGSRAANTSSATLANAASGKEETLVSAGSLRPGGLKTGSGPDAELLNAIYEGAFDKIRFDRSSPEFAAIGSGYIEAFSGSCKAQLPANRVELTETVCDAPYVITNGYGMIVREGCSASHKQGTGIFADPKLYAALNSNPIQQAGSTLRVFTDMLTGGGNPFTAGVNLVANVAQMQADVSQMVPQTGCTNPSLIQFQKNLERFALGQGGLRLNHTVEMGVALLPATPGTKYRDSDYRRLIDDLVNEQGKSWAMNRYIPGSIGATQVEKRDGIGRPSSVSAEYAYSSLFTAQQSGRVTLSFEEGRPHCLYFSDQSNACRTPSNRLTSAYIRGEYR
ncbi:hypothetical protein [Terriglobus sp.]|uniref:hypothetical protein n=1 Tax=Terriglobus sp. TaxID=1889013 RepID=UPI003AFFDC10